MKELWDAGYAVPAYSTSKDRLWNYKGQLIYLPPDAVPTYYNPHFDVIVAKWGDVLKATHVH